MRTAVVSTCSAIGGRSLVTVSVDGLDPVEADDDLGDAVGEALQQDVLVLPHDGRHLLGDEAVVDGVAELVAAPGVAQVDEEGQVDAQRLGHLPLVRQGADHGRDEEARDVDPIAHGGTSGRQGSGQASGRSRPRAGRPASAP